MPYTELEKEDDVYKKISALVEFRNTDNATPLKGIKPVY